MSLRLYNTMTRQVEPFAPMAPPRVTLYTCGPTVWSYAHIGNFRTFLFEDLLRRWLQANGFEVFQIMNLTDVDDRIISEAAKKGIDIDAFVAPYIVAFNEDREWLRIRAPEAQPRATSFVPAMVRLVEGLLAKGVAYRGEDGSVYFSIERFPAYGRLSRLDRRELRSGASGRVATDEYAKEDARDFALWKAAQPQDEQVGAAWDAPFGRGRPGWHLECSAMALDLIGSHFNIDVLDIHAGGVDLIFPHHEDEIAQSCAFTGQADFARVWMHGEFLNIRGTKMSKRFGNLTTPRDLKADGVDPAAVRLLVFQTHYRQKLDLTDEGLDAAREGARRLGEFGDRLERTAMGPGSAEESALAQALRAQVTEAMNDDLNAPRAVAAVFDFVRDANRLLDASRSAGQELRSGWAWIGQVLDIAAVQTTISLTLSDVLEIRDTVAAGFEGSVQWAEALAGQRLKAKRERNFKLADEIRDQLKAAGFEIRDTKNGSEVIRSG